MTQGGSGAGRLLAATAVGLTILGLLARHAFGQGKVPKRLSDIKAGDKIRMRWVREKDILVGQSITLQ